MSLERDPKSQILIVEDDPGIAELYETIFQLRLPTFEPVVFYTGREGLDHFKKYHPRIHWAVIDQQLPDIKGDIIAEEVRRITRKPEDPYIFLITATPIDRYIREAMFVKGVNEVVVKPFSPGALVKRITELNQRLQLPDFNLP